MKRFLVLICCISVVVMICTSCGSSNKCSACHGSGFSNGHLCNYCRGKGTQSYGDDFWKGKEYKYPGN